MLRRTFFERFAPANSRPRIRVGRATLIAEGQFQRSVHGPGHDDRCLATFAEGGLLEKVARGQWKRRRTVYWRMATELLAEVEQRYEVKPLRPASEAER